MTAYWINTFTAIHDETRLARYVELAGGADALLFPTRALVDFAENYFREVL